MSETFIKKPAAPQSVSFTRDGKTTTHRIVYFKRNNGEILSEHFTQEVKRMEGLGYTTEVSYEEQ